MLYLAKNVLIELMNNEYILNLTVNLKGDLLWVWDKTAVWVAVVWAVVCKPLQFVVTRIYLQMHVVQETPRSTNIALRLICG